MAGMPQAAHRMHRLRIAGMLVRAIGDIGAILSAAWFFSRRKLGTRASERCAAAATAADRCCACVGARCNGVVADLAITKPCWYAVMTHSQGTRMQYACLPLEALHSHTALCDAALSKVQREGIPAQA